MLRILTISVPLLLATACTQVEGSSNYSERQAQKLAEALEGMQPGETRRCIDKVRVNRVDSAAGKFLFVQGRNKVAVTDATGCPGAARGDLLVFETTVSGSYCSGDIVHTRSRTGGMLTGTCALRDFTEYTRPE